ncbi:alpha/beta hydrolase [Streptomyces sp. NA04227]|uniref:alpha/beta fold hydrolase n=1 Tax=Streptomyces sp. NA04227 TaxID=2742136 RepID=UPI0015920383|nr:alpha/beta fold hydrolase [Streptomyces sp. NA04227]QKW10481.1 alpha/beta hydrolase [Streptomyces sp. NA04227]
MTAFVLVSEIHTGAWVWRETTALLREAGAEVHPVTLTGMGDIKRPAPAEPGTDLETHIEDLVRLLDVLEAPDVVLVGHGYGIHPVLAAADRRPDRVSRVVHVDAGMPQDGDIPAALVPDQAIREYVWSANATTRHSGTIAPPPPDGWQRYGSLDGVSVEDLALLDRLAVPQPVGTLAQPLRLTGAGAKLPTTGILCTSNGAGIAMIEALVAIGDPKLAVLTEPRVTFFELPTGHWPMLSVPGELAEALLCAAAGEGHRIMPKQDELPGHLRPFLLNVPEQRRERIGNVDLYFPDHVHALPAGGSAEDAAEDRCEHSAPGTSNGEQRCPAVVFVHGGPLPEGIEPRPRDWPGFSGHAHYVAGLGVIGVTLEHRLHDLTDYGRAAEDVAAAVDLVRADPRVDPDRIALWFFSAGGLLSAPWLAEPPSWLRGVAASYPILVPLPNWGIDESRFRPAAAVSGAGDLPIVLIRVGREMPEIATTVAEFLAAAGECGARVEVIDVPEGHHGFETLDHTDEARTALAAAMRSVIGHLRS